MRNVIFIDTATNAGYDMYADYGLVLQPRNIPRAAPKIRMVEIDGRSGSIDLTEELGVVRFDDLTFDIELSTIIKAADWESLVSDVAREIHGRRMKIHFSDDIGWYYSARVSITDAPHESMKGTIKIHCIAEPFKRQMSETVVSTTVSGSKTVTLSNDVMPISPKAVTSAPMNLSFVIDGRTFNVALGAGTYNTVPDLVLPKGDTDVTITGNGNITFTYRKGTL